MSSEKMNAGMEKIFFRHILDHPDQISKVEPAYFKNIDIQFVYNVIRENYLLSKKKVVPTPNQILAMVKMRADEREITKDLLKILLQGDNKQYEEEWLGPRFKAWKLSNRIKDNVMQSVEYMRNMDDVNYDNIQDIAAKIKNISNELDLIDDDNDDLGEDFDDPLAHRQDETTQKIPTGWNCIDSMLNGGWDYASLVVLIGETNVGKCINFDGVIEIRNKYDNKIEKIRIGDFYELIRNWSRRF